MDSKPCCGSPSSASSAWIRSRPKRQPIGSRAPNRPSGSNLGLKFLELLAVGLQLFAFGLHHLARGLRHEALVGELALAALHLGAKLCRASPDPLPHLRGVDVVVCQELQ